MATELLIDLRLDWSDPGHYVPGEELPCEVCEQPTTTRTRHGRAFHQGCAQQAIVRRLMQIAWFLIGDERFEPPAARGLLAERYGFSMAELAAEVCGPGAAPGHAAGEGAVAAGVRVVDESHQLSAATPRPVISVVRPARTTGVPR